MGTDDLATWANAEYDRQQEALREEEQAMAEEELEAQRRAAAGEAVAEPDRPVLEQFYLVEATFRPRREDDLREAARKWIGWRGLFEASWIIEEGEYSGEWACSVRPPIENGPPADAFVWVPEGDLVDMVDGVLLAATR